VTCCTELSRFLRNRHVAARGIAHRDEGQAVIAIWSNAADLRKPTVI
jgi:hypothetical protein